MWNKLFRKEEGISALEYILIAMVTGLAILAGASFLGDTMDSKFNEAGTVLQNEAPNQP